MSLNLSILILFVTILASLTVAFSTKGIVNLDAWTFEKVLGRFKTVLVKFDSHYPYGEKQEQFGQVAESASTIPDFLIAAVGVREYGEKENIELAEKYNVTKEDYPTLKLFLNGKTENPINFTGQRFTADEIKQFIIKSTGIYIGLASCIKELDVMAKEFMAAGKESERKKLLEKAKTYSAKLKDPKQKKSSETYLKLMQKVLDKGDKFVESERERVKKIHEGKLSAEKKRDVQSRINILSSFSLKDEL